VCLVVTERDLRTWVRRSNVVLDDADKPSVRRSIRATRTAGIAGAFIGFVVLPIATGVPIGSLTGWLSTAAAMLTGLVLAELLVHRPTGAVVSARLDVRLVSHYIAPRLNDITRAGALAAAVLMAVASLIPATTDGRNSHPSGLDALGVVVAALLTATIVERVQSWIVARPQPHVSDHAVQVDDAIRARSVHVLAGAAIFVEGQLLSVALWAVGFRRGWEVFSVLAVVVAIAGMVASVRVSNRRWTGRTAVAA
jgi:hypothetical protein